MSWYLPPRRAYAETEDLRQRYRASLRGTYVELMPELLQRLEETADSARVAMFRQECRRLQVDLSPIEGRIAALELRLAVREVHGS